MHIPSWPIHLHEDGVCDPSSLSGADPASCTVLLPQASPMCLNQVWEMLCAGRGTVGGWGEVFAGASLAHLASQGSTLSFISLHRGSNPSAHGQECSVLMPPASSPSCGPTLYLDLSGASPLSRLGPFPGSGLQALVTSHFSETPPGSWVSPLRLARIGGCGGRPEKLFSRKWGQGSGCKDGGRPGSFYKGLEHRSGAHPNTVGPARAGGGGLLSLRDHTSAPTSGK